MSSWLSFFAGNSSLQLWESAKFSLIKNITVTQIEVGRGSYGVVYSAMYGGKECVAKEIHHNLFQNHNSIITVESFIKEINILSALRHPSMVNFLGVYLKEGSDLPILIFEKMWKSLSTLLSERPSIPLIIKVNILKDVACGLNYLYSQKPPVLHRNLTSNNVLLSTNLDAKIADLGLAKTLETITNQCMSTTPGALAYMAPESLQHDPKYSAKSDVFSFGCVILHTVTQEFPSPSDQYQLSELDNAAFLKVSEYKRRSKYWKMMENYPHLTYLASACLKDDPEYRPNSSQVFAWIEEYWTKSDIKEHCTESIFHNSKIDKFSLVLLLDAQSTRTEELESTVKLCQMQVHELTNSTVTKDQQIAMLQRDYKDQKISLQSQLSENDQLKSQCEKLQRDISQQSNSEIIMNLSSMLKQEQEDMKEKQEEVKRLKAKLNDLEKSHASLRIANVKDSTKDASLKEAELIQSNELLSSTNASLIHEKEKLNHQLQIYITDLQNKQKEIEELKLKLDNYNQSVKLPENTSYDLQSASSMSMEESRLTVGTESASIEKTYLQNQIQKEKPEQQVLLANQLSHNHLTEFNKNVMDMQIANEIYAQKEKQVLQCLSTLEKQTKEITQLNLKFSNAKSISRQQLDEKSLRLSMLQPQLNACQQKLDVKGKELSDMQSQNENLQKLLENISRLHTAAQKEINKRTVASTGETDLSVKVQLNADKRLEADLPKYQDLLAEKEKEIALLNETLQKYHEHSTNLQQKVKDLEKKVKNITLSHSKSSRQLENKLKEKFKYIESLEKKTCMGHSSLYNYSLHWSPYLSLPVVRIKLSAAVVKDKVFVTGGYQEVSPQGKELESYLKSLERSNEMFCFHTGKCRCDSITSPVALGSVASVNGQCVLVSGVEGNTLTGNVYVLCEEGSDEQWKKFSEPVPTPRILPCVCCYGDRWLIVCGGYTCKEGSNLLEAVNVVEILDSNKGEWFTIPVASSPNLSTILACSIVGDDVYITGDDKVLRISCSKLVSAISAGTLDSIAWRVLPIEVDNLHPFSVVDVNGEPMVIASISGSEDDVTCVLMKDTTDMWRKMSEAVECQHCSAVVVTPTLELLLFGGSGNVQLVGGTDACQNGTLVPIGNTNIWDNEDEKTASKSSPFHIQENTLTNTLITQPPAVSFIGPIHTKQFDHKGGTFQSPVHKVSIVVPPDAIDDGEKVTVHMGATTSGPFDLPEDCKLRSAVVWLGSSSDVVLKRSIAVVVPHSAVFTSPQHHSMMRFLTCEDCEGPRYKLQLGQDKFEIAAGYGLIRLQRLVMVAIVSQPESIIVNEGNVDKKSVDVPVCFIATLFWPPKSLPVSFRADVFCVQNIPSELYKVDILCKKAYYKENRVHPEVVGIKLIVYDDKLKCVLPCISDGSNECNCFTGWDVTPLTDITEAEENIRHHKINSIKFSFKFNCFKPGALLSCCFEFQGANREGAQNTLEIVPKCLKSKFFKLGTFPPILLQSGVNREIESFSTT